jgi:hypothetical protein
MRHLRLATVEDLPTMRGCAQKFYASSKFLKEFDIDRFTLVWTNLFQLGIGVIFLAESNGQIDGAIGGIVHRDIYGDALIAEEFLGS